MGSNKCEQCRYWVAPHLTGAIDDHRGECRFNPPPFPLTTINQWCGKFTSRTRIHRREDCLEVKA